MQSPENELKPWYYIQKTEFGPYDIYDPNRGFNRWVCQANCKADADNIVNAINNEPDHTQIRKEVCEEILREFPKAQGDNMWVLNCVKAVLRVRDKEAK